MNTPEETFDWEKYGISKGDNQLIQNPKIKGQNQNAICYSFEPYAQQFFDLYTTGEYSKVVRKDLQIGDTVPIVDILSVSGTTVIMELEGGLNIDIDLSREKKFGLVFGYSDPDKFANALSIDENKKNILEAGLAAYVVDVDPIKISLWNAYILKTKEEFLKEIENPTKAYVAKIKEANKGGYFVEVQGVDAFMPGSLAAPNKIRDFRELLDKEVVVMIEDYIKEMKSFIVSHKKYIDYVLPIKIKELDYEKRYMGKITGTSKYGIFLEFEDIFTGLLHVSKMKGFTLDEFRARRFESGDHLAFYINEITKDSRIILTEESPSERKSKIHNFIDLNGEKKIEAKIAAKMPFGVIVNYDDISGLIPNKEFRKRKIFIDDYEIRDKIYVEFMELKDDKILFKLPPQPTE